MGYDGSDGWRLFGMGVTEGGEVSTSSDCDVILVLECKWKIHIGETGYV